MTRGKVSLKAGAAKVRIQVRRRRVRLVVDIPASVRNRLLKQLQRLS